MSGLELLVPLGLVALLGLPVVVLLHMRHTTPDPRPVPTLRFWQAAAQEQTERARFRRPPLSLLLLLQLLIVALLAFGLTRPAAARTWAGLGLRTEPRHVIVLLDGSTSMAALDTPTGSSRFETARAAALERVRDLREGDVATVVLLGTGVTTMESTNAGDLVALQRRLATLRAPGGRANLASALALTRDLLLPHLDDQVVLITDGALTVDPAVVATLGAPVELVQVGGIPLDPEQPGAGNVAITELSARAAPGNPEQRDLFARVANFGDLAVVAPVMVKVDGIEFARQEETLPPGGTAKLSWTLPPDASAVTVVSETPDPLPADDQASLILRQESDLSLKILLVSDLPGPLQRALEVLPGAEVTTEPTDGTVVQPAGEAYDLVVYDNVSPPAAPPGSALLLVHPPAQGGPFPTRGAMTEAAAVRFGAHDPLLEGVDLAGVTFGETPVYVLDGTQSEVVGAEGGPLIFRAELNDRPTVVLGFDIAQTNLPQRVAFPILIANVAAQLVPSPLPPALPLGDPLVYRPSADAASVRVTSPDGNEVDLSLAVDPTEDAPIPADGAAPDQDRLRAVSFADTGQPGQYQVAELDAVGDELGGGRFVVNAGHPLESDLRPNPDLPAILATARGTSTPSVPTNLADLWPVLVAAALVLLALEWLMATIPRRRRSLLPRPALTGRS
ncbi:MAG: VWA domain-containing protein [Chloroflexota bacterium]|nr:VWA domain-containing protein [Chloroflexota bacterium]